jgi:flagellar motor protein MotB
MVIERASDTLHQFQVAQAGSLALRGEWIEAEQLLAEAACQPEGEVARLDLLARVKLAQGNAGEATRLWREAEALAPNDPLVKDALGALKWRPFLWLRSGMGAGLALSGLVVVIMFAWIVSRPGSRLGKADSDQLSLAGKTAQESPVQPSENSSGQGRQEAEIQISPAAIAAHGSVITPQPGGLLISFPQGLFAEGKTLSSEGAMVLAALGPQLRNVPGPVRVSIEGQSDGLSVRAASPFVDNDALRMERAVVAATALRAGSGLPIGSFVIEQHGPAVVADHQLPGKKNPSLRTVSVFLTLDAQHRKVGK